MNIYQIITSEIQKRERFKEKKYIFQKELRRPDFIFQKITNLRSN